MSVEIDFDGFRLSEPTQRALYDKANAIPTRWTTSKENLEILEQAGTILLQQAPCFQRLLLDMNISADFIDPAYAKLGCRQLSD